MFAVFTARIRVICSGDANVKSAENKCILDQNKGTYRSTCYYKKNTLLNYNLVLSTELTMYISHRKEIRKLTFQALALRWSESRNCGSCVAYIQKDGATLLVGAW